MSIVSHKNQEIFNIIIMRFINSVSYVQYQINDILQSLYEFVQTYINNIIVFSKTLKKYKNHLHHFFSLFIEKNIVINSKKTFIRFSIIWFLDQKISFLNLIITKKKMKIIIKLEFSRNLIDLKTYFKLIRWMCQYILYYVFVTEFLQKWKILLMHNTSQKKSSCKMFVKKTLLKTSISQKLKFYKYI